MKIMKGDKKANFYYAYKSICYGMIRHLSPVVLYLMGGHP